MSLTNTNHAFGNDSCTTYLWRFGDGLLLFSPLIMNNDEYWMYHGMHLRVSPHVGLRFYRNTYHVDHVPCQACGVPWTIAQDRPIPTNPLGCADCPGSSPQYCHCTQQCWIVKISLWFPEVSVFTFPCGSISSFGFTLVSGVLKNSGFYTSPLALTNWTN